MTYPIIERAPLDLEWSAAELGYFVKDLPDGRKIYILQQIFNWRIVRTCNADPLHGWDRAYCYFGLDWDVLLVAAVDARNWDGADDTEPMAWDKRVLGPEGTRPAFNTHTEVTA